jgi:hypothetical protein
MPIKQVGDMNTYNGGVNHNQPYTKVSIHTYDGDTLYYFYLS